MVSVACSKPASKYALPFLKNRHGFSFLNRASKLYCASHLLLSIGVNEWFAKMARVTVAGSPPDSSGVTVTKLKKEEIISDLQRKSRTQYGFFEPDSRPLNSDPPVSPCAGYLLAEGVDEYGSDEGRQATCNGMQVYHSMSLQLLLLLCRWRCGSRWEGLE